MQRRWGRGFFTQLYLKVFTAKATFFSKIKSGDSKLICFPVIGSCRGRPSAVSAAHRRVFEVSKVLLASWTWSRSSTFGLILLHTEERCFVGMKLTCLALKDHYTLFVCIPNQISSAGFINLDKLASDKPVALSHFRAGMSPRRWWEVTVGGGSDLSFRSAHYCLRLGLQLHRESLPLMENYCLPLRTYNVQNTDQPIWTYAQACVAGSYFRAAASTDAFCY